jgi:hypothetical protein
MTPWQKFLGISAHLTTLQGQATAEIKKRAGLPMDPNSEESKDLVHAYHQSMKNYEVKD